MLVHGCRQVQELAYGETITEALPNHEFLGEMIAAQLVYYPTVTREPFRNRGRITDLMVSGKLFEDNGLPPMSIEADRFKLCGSPDMIRDTRELLTSRATRRATTARPATTSSEGFRREVGVPARRTMAPARARLVRPPDTMNHPAR